MKRTIAFLAVAIAILALIPLIHATGTAPIKKAVFSLASSFSGADTTYIADHFNLIVLNPDLIGYTSTIPAEIKGKNSAVQIYAYWELYTTYTGYPDWATVNANEDWFLHTAGGDRIKSNTADWLLMDPASAGWRAHLMDNVNNAILDDSNYAGLYLDDVHDSFPAWWDLNGTIQAGDAASLHADTIAFLQYIEANIGGKPVLINTDEWVLDDHAFLDEVEGAFWEGWAHATWETPLDHSAWNIGAVDYLAEQSTTGKTVVPLSGTLTSGYTQAQIDRQVLFNYAAYLLGVNGSAAHLEINQWNVADGSKGYYGIMDYNLGDAPANYQFTQDVYMRGFTDGMALLNPSGTPQSITLSGYKFFNSSDADSFTLDAWEGVVLLTDAAPTPTPSPTPTPTPVPPTPTPVPVTPTPYIPPTEERVTQAQYTYGASLAGAALAIGGGIFLLMFKMLKRGE